MHPEKLNSRPRSITVLFTEVILILLANNLGEKWIKKKWDKTRDSYYANSCEPQWCHNSTQISRHNQKVPLCSQLDIHTWQGGHSAVQSTDTIWIVSKTTTCVQIRFVQIASISSKIWMVNVQENIRLCNNLMMCNFFHSQWKIFLTVFHPIIILSAIIQTNEMQSQSIIYSFEK